MIMKNPLSRFLNIPGLIVAAAFSANAESLPQIQLQPVFANLAVKAPVWMCQAPDDTGRFFVVGQDGVIFVVKKGSDGSDAKEFLSVEDRHVHFNREDGLLSIAFHPGFKTNGLCYVYFTIENKPEDIKRLQNGLPVAFPFRSVISEFKVSATDPD